MPEISLPRRHFLSALGAGASLPLLGWPLRSPAAETLLEEINSAEEVAVSPEIRFLQRSSFGITPESVARIRNIGTAAYVEEQLNWQAIDDSACEAWVADNYPTTGLSDCELMAADPVQTGQDLINARLFRAVFTQRQLYEVMVDFWTDHFNVFQNLSQEMMRLKTKDDLQVIRPHALGSFRDMLNASMHSPAMLLFLDNWKNVFWGPNENYARELMELHTLGVDGGYTEQDVKEVARCLTGWTTSINANTWSCSSNEGGFLYYDVLHDKGDKTVLGHNIASSGVEEGRQVLDILIAHPSTPRFLAGKLCRYFVSDNPSQSLIGSVASAYGTDGDIKAMLRVLLLSQEFSDAPRVQYRRPLQYAAAALRALGVQPDNPTAITYTRWLVNTTGHTPFQWTTPDGYPQEAGYWLNTHGNLSRWMFALLMATGKHKDGSAIAGSLAAGSHTLNELVSNLSLRILGHELPAEQHSALAQYVSYGFDHDATINDYHRGMAATYVTALLLSAAAFQIH